MAPRGRPPKKDTRMDAAIDALSPMGFSESLIRNKVQELLVVYDGGWGFIEEFAYKVLLEAIIEDQEKESEKKNNVNMEDGGAEPSTAQDDSEPPCDAHHDDDDDSDDAMVLVRRHRLKRSCSRSAATAEPPATSRPVHKISVPDSSSNAQTGGRAEWKDISCMEQSRAQQQHGPTTCSDKDEGPGCSVVKGSGDKLRVSVTHHLPVSRKPCYGWIRSDGEAEEGEEDFVFSETEASRRKEMKRRMMNQQTERKSRFDVK
ncbi:hypothetical protein ACHQM5_020946 [Ranunculus cassubicifolius]